MRLRRLLRLVPLLTTLTSTGAVAQGRADVHRLRWLGGCWEHRVGSRVTQEQWMAPVGGLMLGMSRTVSGEVVRAFEQLRIEVRQGKATYVAQPSGQPLAAFTATRISDTSVVFENPQHDFPTTIRYRRVGTDSLLAGIEGVQGGKPTAIDFPMTRVPCDG